MAIRIYGHSDDCIEIEGDVDDELGAYDRERCITVGGEGEGIEVRVSYHGTWRFAVSMIDEDVPCPWSIRIEPKHGYSQQVVIDCPPGTPVDFDEKDDE
jgi:hypothetical protein